jgi:hypothetical protein
MPRRGHVNPRVQGALLRHQVDLFRLEADARKRIQQNFDKMMKELQAKLLDKDITKFSKARVNALLSQAHDTIQEYYAKAQSISDRTLRGTAQAQASAIAGQLETTYVAIDYSATLPSTALIARVARESLIMGATSEEWWARQARDTAFRYSNTIRQGIVAGDTTEQIAARVAGRAGHPGIMDVTRANARSLVHTSIMEVANDARRETFKANDDIIEGVHQVSTLDSNTTDICVAYDGAEFTLDGDPINGTTLPYESGVPRHWGCRSLEVPITKTFKELGIDVKEPSGGQRASEDGPVPAKWTFDDFLGTMSKEEQNDMLGEGRADLWREGKITLQQLLDQHGNPLSLKELEKKYG